MIKQMLFLLLFLLFVTACADEQPEEVTPTVTEPVVIVVHTVEPTPTATAKPTVTPSATPIPTATLTPTPVPITCGDITEIPEVECEALETLLQNTAVYQREGSIDHYNWFQSKTPCTWWGITCIDRHVAVLEFPAGLEQLPLEILDLKYLIELDLSENNLTAVPPEISGMQTLTRLDLSYNWLNDVPSEIGEMTNLTWLSFWRNNLESLPLEIGQLTNLEYLAVGDNKFEKLSPELCAVLPDPEIMWLFPDLCTP